MARLQFVEALATRTGGSIKMSTRYSALSYCCISIVGVFLAGLALGQTGGTPITIGIALPQGQLGGSAQVAEPMRQSLINQLRMQTVQAVPLTATSGSDLESEAQAKHCTYVLYTRLEQKHSMSGMFSKFAPLAGALPVGALAGRGGMASMAGAAMQGATSAAAASAQQQAVSQLTGAAQSSVKGGDTVTLDYRLVPVGSTNPAKAETLSSKAAGDGQDVVSPLIAQLTSTIAPLAQGVPSALGAPPSTPPGGSGNADSSNGHSSLFSGLGGHKNIPSSTPTAGAGANGMDCAKMASMPNAFMTVETCQKLQGAQQAYNQAAADPSASRPGDDQMTCAQITAELKQQSYTAPDQAKVAAAQATSAQEQALLNAEYAHMMKAKAEDQALVNAASAADNATEAASMGLVRGRNLQAAENTIDARNRAYNETMTKEGQPIHQQTMDQMAGFATDAGQQLQSNPRLARLMQLANAKHCKGGG